MRYHNPVLLDQSIEALNISPTGTYVDVTFGGGGHSYLILKKLKKGKLFAFDQDDTVKQYDLKANNFKLINTNFRYIENYLKLEGINKIDGLLADLGVSSHQFDIAKRGFSIRFDGELDMRMDLNSRLSAKEVINTYSENDLANIFYNYGDLKNSRKVTQVILEARNKYPINTTKGLTGLISGLVPKHKRNQFLARVFQSIRIEVNDEVIALKEMLNSAVRLLNNNGRLVIISYHSLEDRIVKNLIKKGNTEGHIQKDFFGNHKRILKEVNKKVITPTDKEIEQNPRARSAKLRIAEKV